MLLASPYLTRIKAQLQAMNASEQLYARYYHACCEQQQYLSALKAAVTPSALSLSAAAHEAAVVTTAGVVGAKADHLQTGVVAYQLPEVELTPQLRARLSHDEQQPLRRFIKSLTVKERDLIAAENILIRDLNPLPENFSEDMYFSPQETAAIVLTKHNRFTPVFTHRHLFFELIYVLSGSCQQVIMGQEVSLREGDFCCVAPDISHAIAVFSEQSLIINILVRRSAFELVLLDLLRGDNPLATFFNQGVCDRIITPYMLVHTKETKEHHDAHALQEPIAQGILGRHAADIAGTAADLPVAMARSDAAQELEHLVLAMYEESQAGRPYGDKKLNGELMVLFSTLLQYFSADIVLPQTTVSEQSFVCDILHYMEEHYQHVTLKELAAHFNLCEAYLSRKIKQACHKSFRELHQDMVFCKVRELLEQSTLSVRTIAQLVGFNNVEHFHRLFRKHFGMTCLEYRRKYSHPTSATGAVVQL